MRTILRGAIAAILLSCAALPARAETPKDTLVQAYRIDDIITLDPAEVFEFSTTEYINQVYDRLIYYNAQDPANFLPGIAESWTVADDGTSYSFKIRDGVKFHSGNPLTAEDAAYSIRRAIKLNLSPAFIVGQFGLTAENVDTHGHGARCADAGVQDRQGLRAQLRAQLPQRHGLLGGRLQGGGGERQERRFRP